MRHRPIGLGVQGLADTFAMLGMYFESDAAKALNKEIFETIYFASCTASKDAAIINGPYIQLSKDLQQVKDYCNSTYGE